jgi:hypothetical protein
MFGLYIPSVIIRCLKNYRKSSDLNQLDIVVVVIENFLI